MNPLRIGILDYTNVDKSGQLIKIASSLIDKTINPISPLYKAIKRLGHIPVVYKAENCQLIFENTHGKICYNNKKIKGCDVLIPRLDFCGGIDLEISLIKQFQIMGIPVINRYLSISYAKNKLRTLQILTKKKLPVPDTIVVRRFEYMDGAIEKVGGYPVIIKAPFGTEGRKVALLESRRSLYSALDIIWGQNQRDILLIQEYLEEAKGIDYRAFVIGDKVVATMKRTAQKGDFRSNISLGGSAEKAEITKQEKDLAVRATKMLGLEVCGIDIMRGKKGAVIIEANANPGLLGIMNVTGVDVAEEMVKFAITKAITHE